MGGMVRRWRHATGRNEDDDDDDDGRRRGGGIECRFAPEEGSVVVVANAFVPAKRVVAAAAATARINRDDGRDDRTAMVLNGGER